MFLHFISSPVCRCNDGEEVPLGNGLGLFAFLYEKNLSSGRKKVFKACLQNIGRKPMNCSYAVYVQINGVVGSLKFFQLFEQLPCSLFIQITLESDGRTTSFDPDSHLKLFQGYDVH